MAEGQGNTERYTVEQVIAALTAAGGIKLGAAMKLQCSPTTVQNYIDRHPEIGDAIVQIKANTLDLAETKLIEQIGKGNMTAIIFYLKTQGKERGYIERYESTGKDGKPLIPPKAPAGVDLSKLSVEELEAWEAMIEKATKFADDGGA